MSRADTFFGKKKYSSNLKVLRELLIRLLWTKHHRHKSHQVFVVKPDSIGIVLLAHVKIMLNKLVSAY